MASVDEDYSRYSVYNDEATEASFAVQSKTASGSLSLADVNLDGVNNNNTNTTTNNNQTKHHNQKYDYEYYEDLAFALTSPAGLGALTWLIVSFLAVLYGSSITVCFSFCFPLIMVPYIVNEQTSVQLLPSLRKRTNKLRMEANTLAMESAQLKSAASRMQRQEYRLSVVEERFEDICKRSDKDITNMKHSAKKNAALQQMIKANLAANKIHALMTDMLRRDSNGNCLISENEIDNILSNIKTLAGRRRAWRVDRDSIRKDFLNSLTKNKATMLILNDEPDDIVETRYSEERADDEPTYNEEEEVQEHVQEKMEKEMQSIKEYSVASSSQQSTQMNPDPEESWTVSNNSNPSFKPITNNGLLLAKKNRNDHIRGIQATVSNGTVDSPIDIDSILFNGQNIDHIHSE